MEAALVREVAEAFLRSGGRLKSAAADLNARGYRTRQDARWTDMAVGRALKVVARAGVVSEELRERCLALLERRAGVARRSSHPFGGRVACACAAPMHPESSGGRKFVCRACRAKIRLDALEAAVAEGLGRIALGPDEIMTAVATHPRAAELTRRLGGDAITLTVLWPLLTDSERSHVVELTVQRIVVESESVTLRFATEPENGAESGDSVAPVLPSPDDSDVALTGATESPGKRRPAVRSTEELPILLSVDQVAGLLQTTPKAVYAMAERAQLRGVVRVGRRLLVRRNELLDSVGESRAPSPKEVRR
jgi:hypothetical protein